MHVHKQRCETEGGSCANAHWVRAATMREIGERLQATEQIFGWYGVGIARSECTSWQRPFPLRFRVCTHCQMKRSRAPASRFQFGRSGLGTRWQSARPARNRATESHVSDGAGYGRSEGEMPHHGPRAGQFLQGSVSYTHLTLPTILLV
eukprot:1543859-Pyramimonas_sp.AAC.1